MPLRSHWENVYQTKNSNSVSWFSPHLSLSLQIILETHIDKNSPVIDVGGGAANLVDDLLQEGFHDITVLDISEESLEISKKRLGPAADKVRWLASDITAAQLPKNHYGFWHDRAVFHFLVTPEDREKYKQILKQALKSQGYVMIATFSLDNGPTKCSGLEVMRYNSDTLTKELGHEFKLMSHHKELHKTPSGTTQEFVYCLFQKI
jgi:ubiquinone/menaquinone biosynthesis C-methylase UbiE